MKVGTVPLQSILPKQANLERAAVVDVNEVKQQQAEARQAWRESVQRQIAEILAARTDKGENDPRAQYLIDKFKSGKRLLPDEMVYVRQHAPGMIDYIERISRERDMIEQHMRIAPSKMDVGMVVFYASIRVPKHEHGDQSVARAMQFADAQYEYMRTEEYRQKPNSPYDKREKSAGPPAPKSLSLIPYTTMALTAYEQAKAVKRLKQH